MVKIVAKQPVNQAALQQLEILLDPADVDFSNTGSKGFTAEADEIRIEAKGSGLKYLPVVDVPRAGTISQVKVFISDELAYTIKKAKIDIGKLIGASNIESVIRKILSGKDTFKGSNGDDVFAAGAKNDKLSGRGGDDKLYGERGKDQLDGGAGSDLLDGGKGRDTYLFRNAPDGDVDTIANFQAGETIKLSNKAFTALAKGPLSEGQFVEGTEALDGNDRIIWDAGTGALSYDPDGVNGQGATQFATILSGEGNLGFGNILVI